MGINLGFQHRHEKSTMPINSITKQTIKSQFRPCLKKALEHAAKELGVDIDVGSASYSATSCTFKVSLNLIKDGVIQRPERSNYETYAAMSGLPSDGLDKEILLDGERYTVEGLKTNARKRPVIISRVRDRQSFVIDVATAKRCLQAASGAAPTAS